MDFKSIFEGLLDSLRSWKNIFGENKPTFSSQQWNTPRGHSNSSHTKRYVDGHQKPKRHRVVIKGRAHWVV